MSNHELNNDESIDNITEQLETFLHVNMKVTFWQVIFSFIPTPTQPLLPGYVYL